MVKRSFRQRWNVFLENLEGNLSFWPFTKLQYYKRWAKNSQFDAEEWERIARKISKYAPPPRCKRCDSANLFPDQAGYYRDAERWDGAPYLCLDCYNEKHKGHHQLKIHR